MSHVSVATVTGDGRPTTTQVRTQDVGREVTTSVEGRRMCVCACDGMSACCTACVRACMCAED